MEPVEEPHAWMLEIALMLTLAYALAALVKRLGMPRVMGYLLAGIALSLAGFKPHPTVRAFATLGIITLLFHAGLEGSIREFFRGLKASGLIAFGGVIAALAAGFVAVPLLGLSIEGGFALGVILSATSVSLTVTTLEELGKINSREANAIIGAAVVDDILGLALLSALSGLALGKVDVLLIPSITVLAFAFWVAVSLGTGFASRFIYKLSNAIEPREGVVVVVFILLMALSYAAAYMKLSSILLAYALGLGMSSYRYIGRVIESRVWSLITLFMPLFFVYAGIVIDMEELIAMGIYRNLWVMLIIVAFGFLSKIVGCYLAARASGFDSHKSMVIGVGMVPRAEVMLVAAALSYEEGLIPTDVYLSTLMLILFTSLLVPPLLKRLYSSELRGVT